MGKGRILAKKDSGGEARECFLKANEIDKDYLEPLIELGKLSRMEGKMEEGQWYLEKGIKIDNRNKEIWI